jgi:cellulose synthase (UDP-forming)
MAGGQAAPDLSGRTVEDFGHRRQAPRRGKTSALMPTPPTDEEKYSYVVRNLWILNLCSIVGFLCLMVSQVKFSQSSPMMWAFVPFLGFTIIYYLVSLRFDMFTKNFDVKAHKELVQSWRPQSYPTVDVFLPVCGEPIEVLFNTWTYVRQLMEVYPGKVVSYVLDDGANDELKAMAIDFGFRYGTRPNRGYLKKAGNLKFGFDHSKGDYILILDADFSPRSDMLGELLPYMERDKKIGIVQSPQYFRVLDEQNWIERGAGAVQELFYRSVQVSRQRIDGAICVGTCAIYRRAALAENGGMSQIDHSEDVYTGFELQVLGWSLKYVPVALSTGVCPDSAGAFQNQQYRWCMGSLELCKDKKFWAAKMSFSTRLSYLAGVLHYVHTALLTFVGPAIPLVLLFLTPELLRIEYTLWVLPAIIYSTLIFPIWHRAPYRLEAWSIRIMYGWAHVFALTDFLRGRQMGWKPTGSGGAKTNKTRRFWIGVIGWSFLAAAIWSAAAFYRTLTMYPPDFAMLLSAGLFDLVVVGRILVQPRLDDESA